MVALVAFASYDWRSHDHLVSISSAPLMTYQSCIRGVVKVASVALTRRLRPSYRQRQFVPACKGSAGRPIAGACSTQRPTRTPGVHS
jgi:hypothetical protein